MKSVIYDYTCYKGYFLDLIDKSEGKVRGRRMALAKHIGCQVSHITNITKGEGHLSPEQGESVGRFFGLNQNEIEFFLLLISYNRCGTLSLKKFYEQQISNKQKKILDMKSKLRFENSLKNEYEAEYYSHWHYGAIHALLSIKDFQTREALSKKLRTPIAYVDKVLNFLCKTGVAIKQNNRYALSNDQIHLKNDSHNITKHHTNWRLKAIDHIHERKETDLHFSGVVTLSKKDFPKVREIFAKSLEEAFSTIIESKEEDAAVICLDCFKI